MNKDTMPEIFAEVFKYLEENNYEPKLVNDEGGVYIECPFAHNLLSDNKMREYKTKGLIWWFTELTADDFDAVISISIPDKPIVYNAILSIMTRCEDGSTNSDKATLARKKSYAECYQKVYEDLAVRLKEAHDVCVDFSNADDHPFFETFNGHDRVLYKYDIYVGR